MSTSSSKIQNNMFNLKYTTHFQNRFLEFSENEGGSDICFLLADQKLCLGCSSAEERSDWNCAFAAFSFAPFKETEIYNNIIYSR